MTKSAAPTHDAGGLDVLSRAECLHLLRQVPLGRVVFTSAALPAVLPVTFLVDDAGPGDGSILVRTGAHTRLAAAAGSVVAFQTDRFGPAGPSWSVVVTGLLVVVRVAAERARAEAMGLRSWVPAKRDVFLRIVPELVSGRWLPVPATASVRLGRAG